MIHVSIQHKQYRDYTQTDNCIITGEAFYQNDLYQGNDLLQLINSCETKEQFIEKLKQLNGFYALIKNTDQKLFAAVDRVRSIPLFYGQKGTDFFLSDSAEWVRQQVGNTEIDPLAREEFLLTGYVTGPDTLFPNVKQLQAGEALIVIDNNTEISVSMKRYYRFIHENTLEASEEELLSKLDEVLLNIFKRLIKLADGRTLVVPLSGGYDSRLIVLMLKRLGYDNVITFTYGIPGNKESEISKQIANTLGYQWEFVPYSNEAWNKWFYSGECKAYYRMADGLCSLPHIQDWPAVWEMEKQGILPANCIFVPGHSADLPAGSRSFSKPELYSDAPFNIDNAVNAILDYHFSLFDWRKKSKELKPIFIKRIIRTLGNRNAFLDNASAFESWDISERQAKFIINSLRVYDFWGYKWWMPFWDAEFIDYWCRVPLKYRFRKKLYDYYVEQLFFKITGDDKVLSSANISFKIILIDILSRLNLLPSSKCILSNLKRINNKKLWEKEYYEHIMGWYGAISCSLFNKYYTGKENINSFLALLYLENKNSR